MMGLVISFLCILQLHFRNFRVRRVCCAVEPPECSCLGGWESLGSWKHLLHDGPVERRLNVIFPVS